MPVGLKKKKPVVAVKRESGTSIDTGNSRSSMEDPSRSTSTVDMDNKSFHLWPYHHGHKAV